MSIEQTFQSALYYKPFSPRKQVWHEKDFSMLTIIQEKPELLGQMMSEVERGVLNYIFAIGNRYGTIFPAQSTIAHKVGISREYVNRILKKLAHMGFIQSRYRHLTTCLYTISSCFVNPFVRSRLSHLFSAFKWLPITLLQTRDLDAQFTQIYKGINKYISKRVSLLQGGRDFMERYSRKMYGDNPISPAIRGVEQLSLSRWGEIKLSAFPDEAILAADRLLRIRGKKHIHDPFAWFIGFCVKYCQQRKIKPQWHYVSALATQLNVQPDSGIGSQKREKSESSSLKPEYSRVPIVPRPIPEPQPKPTGGRVFKGYEHIKLDRQEEERRIEELKESSVFKSLEARLGIKINPFVVDSVPGKAIYE